MSLARPEVTGKSTTGRKLPTREVCARYLVVDRTIARWIENPELDFPKPTSINGRNYFDEHELDAWDEVMAAKSRRLLAARAGSQVEDQDKLGANSTEVVAKAVRT
jgi:hypothetical protein